MASLSVEEENYVRMSLLLVGISPRAVRTFFDSEFPPACLEATMKKEYNKLFDLKKRRVINQSQWDLLYPRSPDVPDSKMFDVTIMILLLRNLTPTISSLCGYDRLPSVLETTPAADLSRIKYYRNFIGHYAEGKIDTSIFNTTWTDIAGAIERLGGQQMKLECDHLKIKPLDQSNEGITMAIRRHNDEIMELKNKKTMELKESIKELRQDKKRVIAFHQRDKEPWNKRERTTDTLKAWKDNDDKMYVNTRAATQVLKCIKENSCVTVTASSGVGKTATLRHVALQMAEEEGYDVLLITDPGDIVRFYNSEQNTLFVVDDLCGNFSLDQSDIKCWDLVMEEINEILDKKEAKQTKIIAACRLQVYMDDAFESLAVFKACVCNLLSENICLTKIEKHSIAELYLKRKASEITEYYDLFDCFPLLCKLFHDNPELNVTDFFQNPFSVYEAQIFRLFIKGHFTKYCALALCVMFNNKLTEEMLTEKDNEEIGTIIENTCDACKLDRATSRLTLKDELDSLKDTFIKKEQNIYKIIHNKMFDFLAHFYGQKIIHCLIKNADSGLIKERFSLERTDGMDQFITIIPTYYHDMYIQRMIEDWSKGRVQDVFSNINMKIAKFRRKFLCSLNTQDISYQRQLAHTCDVNYKDTALLQCCFTGDISLIQWFIYHNVDINQSRLDGLTPLFAAKGHTEVVKLLLDHKATIYKCRDDWSKDEESIPEEIRNMEQHSIDIYKRALKSGSEKKRDINLVIVGKKGAGKTSLVRRLFGKKITNLESTNGIEIHRRQCKIKSNEWIKIRDKASEFNVRMQKSVVQQLCMKDEDDSPSKSLTDISKKQNVYQESVDKENIINERIDEKDAINGRTTSNIKGKETGRVLAQASEQFPFSESCAFPQTSDQTATEELSAIFKSDVVLKDDEDYTLTLWDFAGDEEFYATHQTFLNPDAVYLVVTNLNDKDKDKANHEHVTFKFWMNTIHCYGCRADTKELDAIQQDTLLNPPVIFIGTHKDELQDQKESSKQMRSHMDKLCKDTRLHLRTCHQISNKNDGNDEFQKIREDIFALAINSKTAEKECPVKFIQLERVLHAEYTSEKRVRILSFKTVKELASKISIPITDEEELDLFLRYQNEIGNLVYFNDIPEYIILDPQWLADAFKCIVTATQFQEKFPYFIEWIEVKQTGKISFKLIKAILNSQLANIREHQGHLLAVMEKFDIIINPWWKTNKSPMNSDEESYFYIPCMMQVQKIEEIDKLFNVKDEYKSTCLCFIFNFLPPYLISHLIVSCLRKFSVAISVQQQEGLFKDCCVFDVSDCGCIKLLLVKYGNMIELQIWQWVKDKSCHYEEILNFIQGEINRILKNRYRMTKVSFEKKWKCSSTSYTCDYGLRDFGKIKDGENFICVEHDNKVHQNKDDWFGESSKGGYGAPPPQQGPGAPPSYSQAPPPNRGQIYGQPPPQQQYGQPPPQQQYGQPPPQGYQPQGYQQPAASYGQPGGYQQGAYGQPGGYQQGAYGGGAPPQGGGYGPPGGYGAPAPPPGVSQELWNWFQQRASLSHNQPDTGLEWTTSEQHESTTIPEINTCSQVNTTTPNLGMPISSPLEPMKLFPPPPSSNCPPGYSGYTCTVNVLTNDGNRLPAISSIFGLPSSNRQIPINTLQQPNENSPWNELFLKVSKELITHWKDVGRFLQIDDNNINIIDINHHDVKEKAYLMLLKWKECKGQHATKEVLIKALEDCELKRVAEIVQEYCETDDCTDPEAKKNKME